MRRCRCRLLIYAVLRAALSRSSPAAAMLTRHAAAAAPSRDEEEVLMLFFGDALPAAIAFAYTLYARRLRAARG